MILRKHKRQQQYVGKGFYWTVAAFFVVIVLSVLLNIYFYRNIVNNTNSEIEKNYRAEYTNCLDQTALFVEEFNTISNGFIENSNIDELAAQNVLDNPDALLNFHRFLTGRYSFYSSSVRHVPYLYFKKSGMTLGREGTNDAYESGIITGLLGFTPEIWDEVSNSKEEIICKIVKTEKMNFARIVLAKEIYKDVVFVYCLEVPLVQKIINQYFLPEGSQSFLMDNLNNTINLNDLSGFTDKYTYSAIDGIQDSASIEVDSAKYRIYHAKVAGEELRYIVLIPETLKEEQMSAIRNAVFITVLLLISVGGILAYFLSKRLYQPVSRMIETIITSTGNKNDIYRHNEFRFISDEMNTLIEKSDSFEKKLELQQKLFSENILARVLKNRTLGIPDIEETLQQHGIVLQGKKFSVFVINVDDYSGWLAMSKEEARTEYLFRLIYPVLKQSCFNFMEEEGFAINLTEEDGNIYGIVIFENESTTDFESAANKLTIYIEKEMKILISLFISEMICSVDDIHTGYQQVVGLLSYNSLIKETNVVAVYRDVKKINKNPSYEARFIDNLKIMLNYMSSKNFMDTKRIIEKLYRETFSQRNAPVSTINSQVMIITNVFIMAINSIQNIERTFIEELNCAQRMSEAGGLSEFLEQSALILEKINEAYRETKSSAKEIHQIIEFINENYQKNDLSAGMVAEHFSLKISALSKIIKKEVNMGFLDYVNTLRIEMAKMLMKATDQPINDIAEAVGYTNSLSMTRAFKKHEGMTPGNFRKV